MFKINVYLTSIVFFLFMHWFPEPHVLFSQTVNLNGQMTGWITSKPPTSVVSQIGLRYIPDLFFEKVISDRLFLDADISMNWSASADIHNWDVYQSSHKFKAYRLWARLSTDRLETRLGLQKINFGSAVLFRPLQWFDRIDPRDPLKITDGVYGLLLRYYFQDNTNIWLWGLYGNNERKGLEFAPTVQHNVEFGGRVQVPLPTGEAGISYHHRNTDFSKSVFSIPDSIAGSSVPENRLGLDGKWDVGVGVWMEGVLIHHQTNRQGLKYQRALTLGIDYTFDVGNGLTTIAEHFTSALTDRPFGKGDGNTLSGLSANYPLGLVDTISAILFYDWDNRDWYRTFTWQRMYDNWTFYLLGFWNPEELRLNQNQDSNNTFAGKGIYVMIVFNH